MVVEALPAIEVDDEASAFERCGCQFVPLKLKRKGVGKAGV
jgi:hypothetical protein